MIFLYYFEYGEKIGEGSGNSLWEGWLGRGGMRKSDFSSGSREK